MSSEHVGKHVLSSNESLQPMAHAAQNRCFGCGPANPMGLHLEYLLAEDLTVVCDVTVADTYEGPRGYVHGGIIATLLDETMSKAVRAHNLVAMTRHMTVDYRRPVPSAKAVRLIGKLLRSEGRKHWTEAVIVDDQGSTLAQGTGLFVEVKPRQENVVLSGEPRPHG